MKIYYSDPSDPSWINNMLCYGEGHSDCECNDGYPRDIFIYIEKVDVSVDMPKDVLCYCNSCRDRLVKSGEIKIEVPPVDKFPSGYPSSLLKK